MSPLIVVCRTLHIAAACSSLGGLLYARAVLWPSLRRLPVAVRAPFLATAMRRFGVIKWTGVAIIALTGMVQWAALYPTVTHARGYLECFALKMTGAAGLFVTTLLLALPLPALAAMHRRRGVWAGLNLFFAGLILSGATLMRFAH
jgi:uncharacterized membrane protein